MYASLNKRPEDLIVVQKYGGTSVGSVDRIQAVAARTAKHVAMGRRKLAVVVSAMSGETNRLVELVNAVNPHVTEKIADVALAAGEQVAVALTAAALEKVGIKAEAFLGFQLGIVTTGLHTKARIHAIDTSKILKCWQEGIVPVVAGFQGVTGEWQITTLGRGGSDTSAVALAVALKADFCEINTDVDGVYSTDPRIASQARLLERMDFNVALEMAALGSKVLHSRCVELAAKYDMPLVVRNTFKPDEGQRTRIMAFNKQESLESPVVSGVTLDKNIADIVVENIQGNSPEHIADIFDILAQAGINVDVIVHSQNMAQKFMQVAFSVSSGDLEKTLKILENLKAKPAFEKVNCVSQKGLAKVSVVGLGMISHPGVAAKVFSALSSNAIDMKMISTSEIKISCLIDASRGEDAVRLLHQAFIENTNV